MSLDRKRSHLPLALLVACVLARPSESTTLMLLVDWYSRPTPVDTLLRTDSVWIPRYDTVARSGFADRNIHLRKSSAFAEPIPVNASVAEGSAVPRSLPRHWYSLEDWGSLADFHGRCVAFQFAHLAGSHRIPTGGGNAIQLDTASVVGSSGYFADLTAGRIRIDRCIDSLQADTLWLKSRMPVTFSSEWDCHSHNPFHPRLGTVRFFPPQDVAGLKMFQGGWQVAMQPDRDHPGWYFAPLLGFQDYKPGDAIPVRFEADLGVGSSVWGTADTTWRPAYDSGMALWFTSRGRMAPPQDRPVLQVWFPTFDRLVLENGDLGRSGIHNDAGWEGMPLWCKPDTLRLRHVDGSLSRAIPIPADADTVWLAGDSIARDPGVPERDSLRLVAPVVDFGNSYAPFAERGADDNCVGAGGYQTTKLVKDRLDAQGLPVWTGRVACDIGNAASGPGNWFKPGYHVLDTTISFWLKKSVGEGWTFRDSAFFPLDAASSNRSAGGGRNFGFCLHSRFEALAYPAGWLEVWGDDDIWLFAQGRLVVDLGGQHKPLARRFEFSQGGFQPGSVVGFDLFRCERHVTGSFFGLASGVPLHPLGTLKGLPTAAVRSGSPRPPVDLVVTGRPGRLLLQAPASVDWTLRVRDPGGRILAAAAGVGSGVVRLAGIQGLVVVEWRSGGLPGTRTVYLAPR